MASTTANNSPTPASSNMNNKRPAQDAPETDNDGTTGLKDDGTAAMEQRPSQRPRLMEPEDDEKEPEHAQKSTEAELAIKDTSVEAKEEEQDKDTPAEGKKKEEEIQPMKLEESAPTPEVSLTTDAKDAPSKDKIKEPIKDGAVMPTDKSTPKAEDKEGTIPKGKSDAVRSVDSDKSVEAAETEDAPMDPQDAKTEDEPIDLQYAKAAELASIEGRQKDEDEKDQQDTKMEAATKKTNAEVSEKEEEADAPKVNDGGALDMLLGSSNGIQKEDSSDEDSTSSEEEQKQERKTESVPTDDDDDDAKANEAGDAGTSELSYPKPKNFAERMMNALETGVAADSITWTGGGKAIALKTKSLKEHPTLTTYFKAKDYSGFIRNCNRWGFRRVAHYVVPPGTVTYENSLFQKDLPHLARHMRMDSDVQDVFARHQLSGDSKDAEKKLSQSKQRNSGQRPSRRPRSVADADYPDTLDGIAATAGLPSAPRPVSNVSPENASEASLSKELMLRRILQLTEDFLKHPGNLVCSSDDSFRTTMELVRAIGQQHQQELVASGHLPNILRLEASVQTASHAHMRASSMYPGNPMASLQGHGMSHLPGHLSQHLGGAGASDPLQSLLLQNRQAQERRLLMQHLPPGTGGTEQERRLLMQHLPPGAGGTDGISSLLQNMQRERLQQQQMHLPGAHSEEQQRLSHLTTANGFPPQQQEPKAASSDQGEVQTRGRGMEPGSAAGHPNGAVARNPLGTAPHEEPQFTTARELLMRVMNQRKA